MAIKTNYNFKGIQVPEAIIRVDRLWGSSKEGWTALVGVYNKTTQEIPAVEASEGIEAQETKSYEVIRDNLIEEFNFQAPFKEDERGYKTIYRALMDKYGGEALLEGVI